MTLPPNNYTRRTGITLHAIERLRERLNGDVKARSDEDLGNLIDHAVVAGMETGGATEIIDKGVPSRLVRLEVLPSPEPLYALVRRNDKVGYEHELVVITLLTQAMVDAAKASGRWNDEKPKSSPMGDKLKTALQLAELRGQPVVVAPATKAVKREAPKPPPQPPPPIATLRKAPTASSEIYLVTWRHRTGTVLHTAEYQKAEINQRVDELLDDDHVDSKSIKIWREVKTRVRVTLEVDEEV